ncbi:ankyrin repeat domain-containing protein [Flavobacterium sharifuzzamanii]|uniref:ankyrin repeat domain-containing protein n=1 Tax=Flavobacterium sharifuzzamanii TaxID=2211133 RepID=UPI000DAC9B61|nr:ankyrin repeat domain-containing protein [Flavobacterium sharifuzzamanii]KAF2082481.1 ankyrin repeat domain-containing protein [Flavobacterium sharifuzzamanii]
MKKTVIVFGTALAVFANFATASNLKLESKNQIELPFDLESPLHLAVCNGDVETVKKSIEYGADVNKIVRNMTPLMLAARFNNVEIVKILLANGAKPSIENAHGLRALDYARYAKAVESAAILKGLR